VLPSGEDATYFQISGGGGENEWRISEDMENRLREEFGFMKNLYDLSPMTGYLQVLEETLTSVDAWEETIDSKRRDKWLVICSHK